jgi:hypothetical protein
MWRRLILPAAAAALVMTLGVAPVSAATPVHVTRIIGPVAGDVPAGALCDFAYHEEDTGTEDITSFTDVAGNLVRTEVNVDVTILHRNSNTGMTLIENLHYAVHVDFLSGAATITGQSWHLRDENGRLVVTGAGLIETNLLTGDVIVQTPNAKAGSASPLCTALGGTATS